MRLGKWKTHGNTTIISIMNNYLPKYENLVNQSKTLQPPKQYQNATDLYTKSLESELQSYMHFRNYLSTNNSTENELSKSYAINSLVLATLPSSEMKGNLVKGSIFTNLHFVYFIQHISHNIGWKVKRFSRCLLRFRASSSVHWTIKLWSYTPTIIFCAAILIFALERCMRRHPSCLI